MPTENNRSHRSTFMIPEADEAAANPHLLRDRPTAARAASACRVCGEPLSSGESAESGVCVRCLISPPSEPSDLSFPPPQDRGPSSAQDAPTLGAYALLEEIGRGGQGVVYRALHQGTNEILAVKTMHEQDASCPEALTRFRREAAAVQSLDHPHIMPVHEVGCTTDGTPFFSMQLASGGSLHQLGAKYRGRWRQIVELMAKISGAVQHAHAHGILHRDLKPGNILFTEDQEPLVTDFGLAKQMTNSGELTQSCTILGTPHYVSPEQAAGNTRDLTPASDVYSLGAILFELLTGRPPFTGDNALAILRQVAERSPNRPRRINPLVPKTLDAICTRCLEHRPTDRYASVQELVDDLKRWCRGEAIASVLWQARMWNVVRRRRATIAGLIGFTGVLFVLLVTWAMMAGRSSVFSRMTSIAVAVEPLEQDPATTEIAHHIVIQLKNELSRSGKFQILDSEDASPTAAGREIFDPLKYGRAINSKVILAGGVRRTNGHLRIITRLLRCDTGDVIWRHTAIIPAADSDDVPSTGPHEIVTALVAKWPSKSDHFTLLSNPSPIASAYYTRALNLAANKNKRDVDSAVELFRRACQIDPQFVEARAMLALALLTQANLSGENGTVALAVATAKDALKADPNSAQAHRTLAACFLKEVRYEEALVEFWQAVELDPQSPGCVQALGVCLREMGRPQQAIPWLERAVRLAPSRGAFNASLGETLVLCRLDAEAESALMRAQELDRDRPAALIDLSALRTWQKQYDLGRSLCAEARQRFPDCRFGSSLAAWIEFCAGNDQQAQSAYESLRAIGTYQQDWEFFGAVNPSSALAYLALRRGATEQVRVFLGEALETDQALLARYPGNPRILHDLAATYALADDPAQAQSYLEKAIVAGWVEHRSTLIDPRFSKLASTQSFRTLLERTFPGKN